MAIFNDPIKKIEIEGEVWPKPKVSFKVELTPLPPPGKILRGFREFAEESLPQVFDKEWRKDFERRSDCIPLERLEEVLGAEAQS